MNSSSKYVVISPVRDEGNHIERTLHSMISQSILPTEWIIVDDGSTDNTGALIDEYAKKYSWIRPLHRQNRGFRESGGGVIEAFCEGYSALTCADWDFIVKFDGDLSFEANYFQRCFEYFNNEQQLGIGGGDVYHVINGNLTLEKNPSFHVRGATKIYRKTCWQALGGLLRAPGWDTLDEVKANMMGWQTHSFPDLKLIHHKYTGSADGTWRGWVKNGRANYIAGYHPIFMILKCAKRVCSKPYLVCALGLLYGFVSGYIQKTPQVEDKQLISYLRKEQISRLLLRESIWK